MSGCEPVAVVNCRTVLATSLGWGSSGAGGSGPAHSFGSASTAEEVTEGTDLSGRTYIVTGATGTLGREVCRVLCMRGAHVVMACRSVSKGGTHAEVLRRAVPRAAYTLMTCDLACKKSVRDFAASFCAKAMPLHGIVCCAGVIMQPYALSRDGHEMHFAVNHLGHFLLVNQLMGELVRTAASSGVQGRIVNVASNMHHFTYRVKRGTAKPSRGIDFINLDEEKGYNPTNAYAQSKLANILHAWSLNDRLRESGANVCAYAAHPGLIGAELKNVLDFPGGGLLFQLAKGRVTKTPAQAAATVVLCAARDGLAGVAGAGAAGAGTGAGAGAAGAGGESGGGVGGGCYYADCVPRRSSLPARDPRLARNLWDESEKLLGLEPGSAAPAGSGVGGGVPGGSPRSPRGGSSHHHGGFSGGGGGLGSPRMSHGNSNAMIPPNSPTRGGMDMIRGGGGGIGGGSAGSGAGAGAPMPESPGGVGGTSMRSAASTPAGTPLKVVPSKSGKWGLGAG